MTYNYQWNQHNDGLIVALNEQRTTKSHFCDITLTSKDGNGLPKQIFAHKCVMAASSGHLDNIINLPDNQQHNLEYDLTCIADADSLQSLVEFAYTGKLVFTTENFDRMTKAIKELKIKNIEQESIDKISEDIEMSRAKKAKAIQTTSVTPITVPQIIQATVPQIVQVVSPPTPVRKSPEHHIVSSKRRIVPKLEGFTTDGSLRIIQVLPDAPIINQLKFDSQEEVRVNQEESDKLLQMLEISMDDVAIVPRNQLESVVEKCGMTPHQKSQVWEIRRKSKNRLAAAKCRKRKLEDIRQNDETFEQLRVKFNDKMEDNQQMREDLQDRLSFFADRRPLFDQGSDEGILVKKMINTITEVLRNPRVEYDEYQEIELEEAEIIVPQKLRTEDVKYNIQIHDGISKYLDSP